MVKVALNICLLVLFPAVLGSPLANRSSLSLIRIVGGQDANIADYPYQVSIMIDSQHACGGSIISTTHILSAAHCFVEESRLSHITVRVGSSFRTNGGQIIKLKKINSHPDFNSDTFDSDIAVLELASSLTFATGVQRIQLPSASTTIADKQNAVATGWGLTSNDGNAADVLQVVTLPLITTSTCQKKYYGSNLISSRMICAGTAGKDSCTGDSGGPLVTNGYQVGIVSWGDICGAASTPGVYTKVTEFLSFINQFLK